MQLLTIHAGATARWMHVPSFKRRGLNYCETVRVLEVRKHTARIEARRRNGTIKRRFVKLSRLVNR